MKTVSITILMLYCFTLGTWAQGVLYCMEEQRHYDAHMSGAFEQVIDSVPSFPSGAEPLNAGMDENVSLFCGSYKRGDIIRMGGVSRLANPYVYLIESVSKDGIRIEAVNRYGGRNYIYDYKWNVVSYVFSMPEEVQVGQTVLDWLTTDKYPERIPKGSVSNGILTALGYRGCYTGLLNRERAEFDVLGTLGVFIVDDALRLRVWECLFEGGADWEHIEREKCVRGILSNYEKYSPELKKEVLRHVSKYLESVDDEKTKYSKIIADFVLEKGGDVPDREYWIYDTSWIPVDGAANCRKDGEIKYKAGIVPKEGGAAGSGLKIQD